MRTNIYDPIITIRRLQDEMNRAFGSAIVAPEDNSTSAAAAWMPAVDVYEYDDRFVIVADVPGVDPNVIDVTMENGVLALSGERKAEERENNGAGGARRNERVFGNFYRRFSLPDTADADRVEARSAHGVLEITLPKKEQPRPKKIEVRS